MFEDALEDVRVVVHAQRIRHRQQQRVGSRNRLGEQFIEDLRAVWHERGVEALRRCAEEEPAQFVRVVASLLPRQLDVSGSVDVDIAAEDFLESFRAAVKAAGEIEILRPPVRLIDVKSQS